MFTDPIADMLTRIRNSVAVKKTEVVLPYSRLKHSLANILAREGFISEVQVKSLGRIKELEIKLKYSKDGETVISGLKRVSKPGQRIYAPVTKIPRVNRGLGVTILSTSKGLMTDRQAYKEKYGGEVICQVW